MVDFLRCIRQDLRFGFLAAALVFTGCQTFKPPWDSARKLNQALTVLESPQSRRYQFWFFYYATGQPVPLSALQLREALDEAALRHNVRSPLILIGHSMGGILARAQVSRITLAEAESILPNVSDFPLSSRVRRSLVFEPGKEVSRVVFICMPHRGSRLAVSAMADWLPG